MKAVRRVQGLGCLMLFAVASLAGAAELPNLSAAIDRIRPSVVAVGTMEPTRNPQFQFLGTGFAVGDGSLIATNSHVAPVVTDPLRREVVAIAVPQGGGDAIVREAVVVARDTDHDLALLKIQGPPVPPVRFGDSAQVREGQTFAFTGFPIGSVIGLYPTTHRAMVSAVTPVTLPQANARTLDAALVRRLRSERFVIFQLDATAYPGNSGSPIFSVDTGEVIAIVNMVFVKGGKESALTNPSGISYSIPTVHLVKLLSTVQ
jgi:serine protease Do